MQNRIKFIVYGDPKGKARPRFRRLGKLTVTYTPKETMEYEESIRKAFKEEQKRTGFKKIEGPVEVEVNAIYKIPVSLSKKKKEELVGKPVLRKPDADNIIKSACDSCNGLAYEDDSQVCKVTGYKYYGLEPRIEVTIKQFTKAIQPIKFYDLIEPVKII